MLPDNVVGPYAGNAFYYSGSGANLDTTMLRTVTLPTGSASFSAQAQFDIEGDWDYAYLVVVDGGATHYVPTNLSTDDRSQRAELRQGHHRQHRLRMGAAHRGPVRVRGPHGADRLPVLDRWLHQRPGPVGR